MDARIDPLALLGLSLGEAHVLRNAGGIVTTDLLRGLVLSQHLLGTRDVTLIHHTQCGIERLDAGALRSKLTDLGGGDPPPFDLPTFDDPAESVRRTAAVLRASPLLQIRRLEGYVFDVTTAELLPVELS
jgi:carbonic anhydrase